MQCTAEHVNKDAAHKSQRCIKNRAHFGKHFDQFGASWDNEHDSCSATPSARRLLRENIETALLSDDIDRKNRSLITMARFLGYDDIVADYYGRKGRKAAKV